MPCPADAWHLAPSEGKCALQEESDSICARLWEATIHIGLSDANRHLIRGGDALLALCLCLDLPRRRLKGVHHRQQVLW